MPADRPAPNWVAGTAACTAEHALAVLLPLVERDVKEMNRLSPEQRRWCRFSVEHDEEGSKPFIRVTRTPETEQDSPGGWSVTLKKSNNRVAVHGLGSRNRNLAVFADPEWDTGSSSCRLRFVPSGKLYKVWEFSKFALEPLFFGDAAARGR